VKTEAGELSWEGSTIMELSRLFIQIKAHSIGMGGKNSVEDTFLICQKRKRYRKDAPASTLGIQQAYRSVPEAVFLDQYINRSFPECHLLNARRMTPEKSGDLS